MRNREKDLGDGTFQILTKDLLYRLLDQYLSTDDRKALSATSHAWYEAITNFRHMRLINLPANEQLHVLFNIAIYINKLELQDLERVRDGLIKILTPYTNNIYFSNLHAAIALSCLAALTNLTDQQRMQRINVLDGVHPLVSRCLSAMTHKHSHLNSLLPVAFAPCQMSELTELKTDLERDLCSHLLGINISEIYAKQEMLSNKFSNLFWS